jgi:hypothetical protein
VARQLEWKVQSFKPGPLKALILFSLFTSGSPTALAQQTLPLYSPPVHARVVSAPINEMSGMVRSRRSNDLFWVHNDSGDSARIFAITGDGRSVLPTYSKFMHYGDEPERGKRQWEGFEVLNASHGDWEDMAIDEQYLYIADVGNNFNMRRDLAIYAISEIDPTASTRSAVIQRWPVHYPEQQTFPPANWHYDAESLFTADGKLYLITKHRETGKLWSFEPGAKLYRLDTRHTDESNVLTLIDNSTMITAATGADVSPDGNTLAIISLTDLWLFDKPAEGDQWLSSSWKRIPLNPRAIRQAEAVAWIDDDTLLFTNEQRDIFRIVLSELLAP